MSKNFNPALPFYRSASNQPNRLALAVKGKDYSYGELMQRAAALAGFFSVAKRSGRVGILATRSMEAYAGILGAAWSGATYVPLNLKWPEERLVSLLRMLDLDALVADENGAALLTPAVLDAAPKHIALSDAAPELAGERGSVVRIRSLPTQSMSEPVHLDSGHLAYVIFTSGTTGMPKGVMISAGALDHYIGQTEPWTRFTAEDRIGETCDVTFDLTVHNMYLCFAAGASLHIMSQLEMLAPSRFIRASGITAWLSVPTVINLMRRTGALKPGVFPSLRLSVFCGEPLPVSAAQAWAAAAPNSAVENIYGPTEATVICMRQTLTDPPAVTESRGILAIGTPYPTMEVAILDEAQQPVVPGAPGEIALCGPQVGIGYFGAEAQTADRFRLIGGKRWYLTGDLGCRDQAGIFHHLGRVDNQVKVKGNRIELEEVEMHLRKASGTDLVAVVAWPVSFGSAEGLVGFVAGTNLDAGAIQKAMAKTLPRYMVPATIHVVAELPVNVNGKIDRRALFAGLEAGASGPVAGEAAKPARELA